MKKLLERYFPVMRSHPERVANWQRHRNPKRDPRLSSADFNVVNYITHAPVAGAADRKILFISDWHWHNSKKNFRQLASLEKKAAEIQPDIVVLGGDIVEDADVMSALPEVLSRLRKLAPECIAVRGNWEVGKRWIAGEIWEKLYADAGITLLCNQSVVYGAIRFHGIDDITSGTSSLPEKLDPAMLRPGSAALAEIIVTHSPDTVLALDNGMDLYRYDMALCGHCHGGQIRIPLLGAIFSPSRYGKSFLKGCFIHKKSCMRMIVSAGMGEKRRSFRLFCRPEIVLLTFRKARHYRYRGGSTAQE